MKAFCCSRTEVRGFIGANAYVIFWKIGELTEVNKAYRVSEYAPGLFVFGSDDGGEAYAFDVLRPPLMRAAGFSCCGKSNLTLEPHAELVDLRRMHRT